MIKPVCFAKVSDLRMSYNYLKQASKIVCIGRNYVAHIKELNNIQPKEPFFFLKPPSSFLTVGTQQPIQIPKNTTVHHEIELATVLGRDLRNLTMETFLEQDAVDAVGGYALALDLTARSVQNAAKLKGLPWTIAKGFDTFCPVSGLILKERIPDPYNVELVCHLNNAVRQQDMTGLMIFNLRKIFVYMSGIMTLKKGDVVLTGTPKGVGPIVAGDTIDGHIKVDGKIVPESIMSFNVVESSSPWVFSGEK